MNAEARREVARLYRYIRKNAEYRMLDKERFVGMLEALPQSNAVEMLRVSLLHLQTRDHLAFLMQEYRIGIKRDEQQQIRNVARYVGLEITRNESNN